MTSCLHGLYTFFLIVGNTYGNSKQGSCPGFGGVSVRPDACHNFPMTFACANCPNFTRVDIVVAFLLLRILLG